MSAWKGLRWPGWTAAAFAAAALTLAPEGWRAGLLLAAADDPASLSDIRLSQHLAPDPVSRLHEEASAALAAGDADLARSVLDLAAAHDVRLPETVAAEVTRAEQEARAPARVGGRFVRGFITGESEDIAGLAGTVTGDLFVFGDIRDAVREGGRWAAGEDADHVILGLAAAGIVVTAGVYASGGVGVPARLGVSVVKSAYKAGHVGAGLGRWMRQSGRGLVETEKAGGAIKAAVQTGQAGALVRFVKDVGRIRSSAGTRAAFDALKVADGPRDVARAARLAEARGGQTRAILKVLGRGALVLGSGAFSLMGWLAGAILTLFGFVASIKAMTERLTRALFAARAAR
ncbi:MAG: hypothetical protein EPO23_04070 [Xanthobacteraceae bacterium]|nr:MAG: hypothetical protein EPO23_04070 [Xanthobacteraceae bacterium]